MNKSLSLPPAIQFIKLESFLYFAINIKVAKNTRATVIVKICNLQQRSSNTAWEFLLTAQQRLLVCFMITFLIKAVITKKNVNKNTFLISSDDGESLLKLLSIFTNKA